MRHGEVQSPCAGKPEPYSRLDSHVPECEAISGRLDESGIRNSFRYHGLISATYCRIIVWHGDCPWKGVLGLGKNGFPGWKGSSP
jgi:hypothetical protein